MKAGFFKRLVAFCIDFMIVNFIIAIVTIGINNSKADNLNKQLLEVQNDYISGEIEMEDYMKKTTSITYDLEEASVVSNTISVVIMIGYFIIFQYLNKGQTLGKKLLKIKIVEDKKDPRLVTIIIRSLLIDNILVNMISILLIFVLNDTSYIMVYGGISMLFMLFVFVSVIMMLYRKDKVGLHDMITHSYVEEV